MIEGVDYTYIFPEGKTDVYIKFLNGNYQDVIFSIGKVNISEESDEDGNHQLMFDFEIIEPNGRTDLEDDIDFKNEMGNLILDVVTKQAEQEINDETGTPHSDESNTQ